MRRTVIVALVSALALAACGDEENPTTTTTVSFPPLQTRAGKAYVPVENQAEAVSLCLAAESDWPREYSGHDRVYFDPRKGPNYFCDRRPR